ncbi:MAG: bifunctional helix-turn-helix transcriptional regulator/GNAT family N-acetyltransferase [Paracoccaceae bacterium]|jgi:DNA-binding MarR family transcriptional regulator/GNAT superfamily N-acetyltransferase|nr:bifunctional helix-turn-helix transcriptional regulator/GNAT family N-acetyltransferase [Paracoccaceae bacterium]
MPTADDLVPAIRAASREFVRHWDLLDRTVGDTDRSASALHALIEIGRSDGLTARDLTGRLRLKKSSVSRLLARLVEAGEVRETADRNDGRAKRLTLTERGREVLAKVDGLANAQAADALARLTESERAAVRDGFGAYARALRGVSDLATAAGEPQPFEIGTGYVPGLVGRTLEMIATRVLRDYPFGMSFETKVAQDMAEFMPRAEAEGSRTWHATRAGRIVGVISIDGGRLGDGLAQLRWFVVDEGMQGTGIGSELLRRALAHADAEGFREVHLWTVRGLDAARRLYDRSGFILAEEYDGDQWGSTVVEQRLVRAAAQPSGATTTARVTGAAQPAST